MSVHSLRVVFPPSLLSSPVQFCLNYANLKLNHSTKTYVWLATVCNRMHHRYNNRHNPLLEVSLSVRGSMVGAPWSMDQRPDGDTEIPGLAN